MDVCMDGWLQNEFLKKVPSPKIRLGTSDFGVCQKTLSTCPNSVYYGVTRFQLMYFCCDIMRHCISEQMFEPSMFRTSTMLRAIAWNKFLLYIWLISGNCWIIADLAWHSLRILNIQSSIREYRTKGVWAMSILHIGYSKTIGGLNNWSILKSIKVTFF